MLWHGGRREFPRGALDVLSESFARVACVVPLDVIQGLLQVLVAAPEPIPRSVVLAASGLPEVTATRAAGALLDAALLVETRESRLVPFHKLVTEWMLDPGHGGVDAGAGHARLARWSREHMFGGARTAGDVISCVPLIARVCAPLDPVDRYAYLHHAAHVLAWRDSVAASVITVRAGRPLPEPIGDVVLVDWALAALADPGVVDGIIACGGGGALVRTMWGRVFEPALCDGLRGPLQVCPRATVYVQVRNC